MNFEELLAANLGKQAQTEKGIFTVGVLADKTGKLKNGASANYVSLTNEAGETIELNPRKAQTLFSKGEFEGIKILVDAVAAKKPAAKKTAAKAKPAKKAKADEVEADKPLSKKEQCIAFYKAGKKAKSTRQEVLAMFATVGVIGPGAATYYQNCKSGKWK